VSYLRQVGIPEQLALETCRGLAPVFKKRMSDLDSQIALAVDELLPILPDDAVKKLLHCFGPAVLPDYRIGEDDGIAVAVFGEAKGYRLLGYAPIGAPDRSNQVFSLILSVHEKKLADPNLNLDKAAEDGLRSILTREQFAMCVRNTQRYLLRENLSAIVRPEMVAYLNIKNEHLAKAREACEQLQRDLTQRRMEAELVQFRKILAQLPAEHRAALEELFEGVWTAS
jgi:hypothetical protein